VFINFVFFRTSSKKIEVVVRCHNAMKPFVKPAAMKLKRYIIFITYVNFMKLYYIYITL